MLKRLGAYPRQNGLALALREIGRIERTLFTLDWIEDPELRRTTGQELNNRQFVDDGVSGWDQRVQQRRFYR